jgi:hypothetical protein
MKKKLNLIFEGNTPLLRGYEQFKFIKDSYLVGNGILINRLGEVVWRTIWSHSFVSILFHEESNLILMDKLMMVGPSTLSLGVCAVNMKNGKYVWKNWYNYSFFAGNAIRRQKKTIKTENLINATFSKSHLYTSGLFKVELLTGKSTLLKSKPMCDPIIPCLPQDNKMPSLKLELNRQYLKNLNIDIESVYLILQDKDESKFIFTRDNLSPKIYIVDTDGDLHELSLPHDFSVLSAYYFYDDKILLYVKRREIYSLYLLNN